MTKKWKCPKHKVNLKIIDGYPDALCHKDCPDIFTIIEGHLCVLDGNRWKDAKTGEYREVS